MASTPDDILVRALEDMSRSGSVAALSALHDAIQAKRLAFADVSPESVGGANYRAGSLDALDWVEQMTEALIVTMRS